MINVVAYINLIGKKKDSQWIYNLIKWRKNSLELSFDKK